MIALQEIREKIRAYHLRNETQVVRELIDGAAISAAQREKIKEDAVALINGIRNDARPGLMDSIGAAKHPHKFSLAGQL